MTRPVPIVEPTARLRRRECFDFDWKFFKGDPIGAEDPAFDTAAWQDVNLPHDWSIEGPKDPSAPTWGSGGWYPGGIAWYRKNFTLPDADRGKSFRIQFDGVYHNSDVWLNGHHLGRRPYGYVSFHYDLTPHLNFGAPNILAVRVDNSDQPNCRWYSGSGIYHHVWLTTTSRGHIAPWGTYVTTPTITPSAAHVRVRTQLHLPHDARDAALTSTIFSPEGAPLTTTRTAVAPDAIVDQTLTVQNHRLWSVEKPTLYFLHTVLSQNNTDVDDLVTPFGIRTVQFDKDKGFLLNNQPLKLKGVCLHHDAGCVGAAVPDRVLQRRLEILKEIGCNAIRTSHNPPAPELLDFCDRMGFLVIDEAFDKWEGAFSKPHEWWMRQAGFAMNWEGDLRSMLERDRNHPSIILWSVGNETGQPGTDEVDLTLKRLVDFVRREEPTRLITSALVFSNAPTLEERITRVARSAQLMDVAGLNYQEPLYKQLRAKNPNQLICGTEVFRHWRGGSMTIYNFDPANPWHDVVAHDYVVGQFIWAGIEYLGESTSFPTHGWPGAIIDTCGFLKPDVYFHRSVWRSEPIVRIAVFTSPATEAAWIWGAPKLEMHWNFPQWDKQLVRVQTQTNCESVELIVNDTSYGVRRAADYPNNAIIWQVPYWPGKVQAIARNGDEKAACDELRTAGPPARIDLAADRTAIIAGAQDVAHIHARLLDAENTLVPNADCQITFSLDASAPGAKILGLDNGDLDSLEPYQGATRSTRLGNLLAIVQSTRQPGTIRLTARSSGLPDATIQIQCNPSA